jgi:hypothetical protein
MFHPPERPTSYRTVGSTWPLALLWFHLPRISQHWTEARQAGHSALGNLCTVRFGQLLNYRSRSQPGHHGRSLYWKYRYIPLPSSNVLNEITSPLLARYHTSNYYAMLPNPPPGMIRVLSRFKARHPGNNHMLEPAHFHLLHPSNSEADMSRMQPECITYLRQ